MKKPILVFVLLLAFILRLLGIGQSLWLDEATSALVVRNFSLSEIISKFLPGDFHPPLYYIILKIWGDLWGTSEVSLRLLSVIFGSLAILVIYFIGKEVKNKTFGILTAFLLATGPLHIYYSQEARMYILASFFVSLAVYFYLRISKRPKNWEWIGFASSISLIYLTDYVALLILPVFWFEAYGRRKRTIWWRKFLLSHTLLLISMFTFWPVFWQQLSNGLAVKTQSQGWWNILGVFNVKNVLLIPIKFMIGRIGFDNRWLYGVFIVGVGGIFSYFLQKAFRDFKKMKVIWGWLVIPLVLGAVVSFFIPILTYFRFIFVLPALYFLISWGIFMTKEKHFLPALSVVLVINFLALAIYHKNPRFQREDWRSLTNFIEQESKDRKSRVIFVAKSQMEGYRYYKPGAGLAGPEGVEPNLDQIWLMRYVWDVFDPADTTRMKVEEMGFEKKEEYDFNGVVVWKYENYENWD